MKEYTIIMKFNVEAKKSDYEKISNFAEELSESIMDNDKLIYKGDIEIVEASVDNIEDLNDYDRDEDFDEDFDENDY